MPTQKQIEANRLNAQKSTGPRTDEGKSKSRLNAFKHGLTGQLDIMTDEQREAHDAFTARIVQSLNPADALESQLAHSIAESYWRMNRVAIIENTLFADADFTLHTGVENPRFTDLARALGAAKAFIEHPERFNLLTVYEMRLHRKAQSELKQLREIQTERRKQDAERRKELEKQQEQPAPKPAAPVIQPVPPLVMQAPDSAAAIPEMASIFHLRIFPHSRRKIRAKRMRAQP